MSPKSRTPTGSLRPSRTPTKANRTAALRDFNQRSALQQRDRYAERRGHDSAPSLSTADRLKAETRVQPAPARTIRQRSEKLIRTRPQQALQAPAPLKIVTPAYLAAHDGVKQQAHVFNQAMAQETDPSAACTAFHTCRRASAPGRSATEEKAHNAIRFVASMANMAGRVVAAPPTSGSPRKQSAREMALAALQNGIDTERQVPRYKKDSLEMIALNGAKAGSIFGNLVQACTRPVMVSEQIMSLEEKQLTARRELSDLRKKTPHPDSVRASGQRNTARAAAREKMASLDRQMTSALTEGRLQLPTLKAKTRMLIAVTGNAERVLLKAAQADGLKHRDRTEIGEALKLISTLRMALEDLNAAYADKNWVYEQLHHAIEAAPRH